MSVIHAPKQRRMDYRVLSFPFLIVPVLGTLFFRLWQLQVVEAPILVEKAEATRQTKIEKLAPRGLIFDRTGKLVAGVKPELVVTAVPAEIKKHPESLLAVSRLVGVPVEKLQEKVDAASYRPYVPAAIAVGISIQVATQIAEEGASMPGVAIENKPMRYYTDPKGFAHVMGYVWLPNERDEKRIKDLGLKPAEYVGKEGIERAYESDLMGIPGGEVVEVDARRRPVRVIGNEPAIPGTQLELTLDEDLQKYANAVFSERRMRGGVVAIEPSTGEVLAMVSAPAYDQSLFYGGISTADWKRLMDDEAKPLLNRPVQAAFAPGSTFKIVSALAAYRAGKFNPSQTVFCGGGYYHNGRKVLGCMSHHGAISFGTAMEKSCNTYFTTIGVAAGREEIGKAARDLGLGAKTGIEIGGEWRACVPDSQYFENWKNPPKWYLGDTVNMAVGQGMVTATPIQMANLAAIVANRGTGYTPHLVRSRRHPVTGERQVVAPTVAHQIDVDQGFWDAMHNALFRVINQGTAAVARIPGIEWAGKTGSAEHGRRKSGKTHSWFIGFAPVNNPKIAICVMAEAAGHGGDIAAPIARDVVSHYLRRLERAASKSAGSTPSTAP